MSDVSRPLIDPPDPESVEARRRLEAGLEAFLDSLDAAQSTWAEGVRTEVVAPFARLVEELGKTHARFVAALPTADAADRAAAWLRLDDYVEMTGNEVWGRLASRLADDPQGAEIDALSIDRLTALLESADRLPASADVPLEFDLFRPVAGDSGFVGLRMAATRAALAARLARLRLRNGVLGLFGAEAATLPPASRTVSMAAHARRQVLGSIRRSMDDAGRVVAAQIDTLVARLEVSADRWSRAVLPALDRTDHGLYHTVPSETPPLPDDPASAGPGAWPEDLAAFTQAAAALTTDLEAALEEARAIRVEAPAGDEASVALRRVLERGGTYLVAEPFGPEPSLVAVERDPRAAGPFVLVAALAGFRAGLSETESTVHRVISEGILKPLREGHSRIREQLGAMRDEAHGLLDSNDIDALRALHARAVDQVDKLVRDLPQPERAEQAFRKAASRSWNALDDHIRGLPEQVLMPVIQRSGTRTVSIPLRAAALSAFERDLAPRIFALYDPLHRELVRVWNEGEQVRQIVDSAFGAAIEELAGPDDDRPDAVTTSAVGLIDDGLRRASEALDDNFASLGRPWLALSDAVHELIEEDWEMLYRSVRADDFLSKQWLGLQSRLTRRSESAISDLRAGWESLRRTLHIWYRAAKLRVLKLVRLGREAVGASEAAADDRIRTLEAVSSASDIYASLPLIYRRLFTLDALSEPGLAVNRQDDVAALSAAFRRWSTGGGPGVFVAHAPPGSGRTSFLNLAARSLEDEARIVRLPLPARLTDEADLAGRLARALEIDGAHTLASVETAIQKKEPATTLALVDNLEHTVLQASGGTRLLEDLLLFFARTDGYIFWTASISDLAWRFFERTMPAAAGLATVHGLKPWERAAIQQVIMERHRRTGMPVVFDEPSNPSPILKQRLRRAKTREDVQNLLREDFFDALFRSAGQDPALALYGWIRTGQFDEDGDVLTMPPFRPLSFAFLNQMDNDRAFTLRAFLVHHTLSAAEVGRIFRFPPDRTMANLETLLALGLIEPVDEQSPASYIVPDTRYRLRRLVIQPVRRFLTERHFVY